MPFTPFHLGPGALFKAALGRHFSFLVFGFVQVLIDLEALIKLFRREAELHGFPHTYLGAGLIAVLGAVIGKPLGQLCLNAWRTNPSTPFLNWLRGPPRLSWLAAWCGAILGASSHVLFDSIMHHDVQPFAPLMPGNGMYRLISVPALHQTCIGLGLIGGVGLCVRYLLRGGPSSEVA
jgi:hypothetical protein